MTTTTSTDDDRLPTAEEAERIRQLVLCRAEPELERIARGELTVRERFLRMLYDGPAAGDELVLAYLLGRADAARDDWKPQQLPGVLRIGDLFGMSRSPPDGAGTETDKSGKPNPSGETS
jgi:hypothetical protein